MADDSRSQALIIKGYLMASNAPVALLTGIEIILNDLQQSQISIRTNIPVGDSIQDAINRFITKRADQEKSPAPVSRAGNSPSNRLPSPSKQHQALSSGCSAAVDDHIGDANKMVSALPDIRKIQDEANKQLENHIEIPRAMVEPATTSEVVTKKYIKLTNEQKDEIAQRYEREETVKNLCAEFGVPDGTIYNILRGKCIKMRPSAAMINKQKSAEKNELPSAPKALPRKDTHHDKLIQDHAGYAGVREDYTLVAEDYGDIQKMLRNGALEEQIAKSYGVTVDYLLRFMERSKEKESAVGNG